MKDFEKKLKDKFRDAVSPEGIDSDELWNNIQGQLKSEDPGQSFFGKYFKYLFLLAFAFAGVFLLIQYNNHSNANISSNKEASQFESPTTKTNHSSVETKGNNAASNNNNNNDSNNSEPSKSASVLGLQKNQINDSNSAVLLSPERTNKSSIKSSTSRTSVSNSGEIKIPGDIDQKIVSFENTINKTNKSAEIKNSNLAEGSQMEQNISMQDETIKINADITPIIDKTPESKTALIENNLSEITTFDFLENKGLFPVKLNESSLQKFQPSEMSLDLSQAKFSIGLYGGIHFMQDRFSEIANSTTDIAVLNNAFKAQAGSQVGLDLIFNLNKNWFGSIGVAYQNTVMQFDYAESWDSTVIRNDIFAGQKVQARATRTVVHHNKRSSISTPINIGYQYVAGRWKLGASAGITAHFIQNQSGKSLDLRNKIVAYPNNENSILPLNKFHLSYQISPIVNYSFSSMMDLQLKSSLGYYQFGSSDFYNAKQNALMVGFGLGLIYTPK